MNATHFRQMTVIWRKELKDAFRDRRAIYAILFSSLFGPLMVGFMMNREKQRSNLVVGGELRGERVAGTPVVGVVVHIGAAY